MYIVISQNVFEGQTRPVTVANCAIYQSPDTYFFDPLPCPTLALPYTSPRVTLYSLVVVVVVIVVAGFGFWAKALVSLAALVQCVHLN